MDSNLGVGCAVVGCDDDAIGWLDGIPHCSPHLEVLWNRWQAIDIYAGYREYLEPLAYRPPFASGFAPKGGDAQ